MNPNLFISALRARAGVFALAFAATVLVATALSLLMPKSYRATVSLAVAEQSLANTFIPPHERMAYLQTQADIIGSERVALKVISDLGLAARPDVRAAFEKDEDGRGSLEGWLAEGLLRHLKVATSQSSIMQVRFHSNDPEFAATAANAFAKAYVDTVNELRAAPTQKAATVFDEQLKTLKAGLERAQARLIDYQKRNGIVSTDENQDFENTRLTDLLSQLSKAQEQSLELESRHRQAREALARGVSVDRVMEIQSNAHVERMSDELALGEAKLQELATQYGVNHPTYQRQVAENRSRRARLYEQMRQVVDGFDNAQRANRQRESDLKAAIAAQRARLLELKEGRGELALLMRNVDTAQKTYDAAMQRFAVTLPEGRAGQTSVAVLNPAAAPREPYQPRIGLNAALAAVVGTMLGIGIVILLEMSDRRVRSFTDLGDHVSVPLLGVLSPWNATERALIGTSGTHALPRPA